MLENDLKYWQVQYDDLIDCKTAQIESSAFNKKTDFVLSRLPQLTGNNSDYIGKDFFWPSQQDM